MKMERRCPDHSVREGGKGEEVVRADTEGRDWATRNVGQSPFFQVPGQQSRGSLSSWKLGRMSWQGKLVAAFVTKIGTRSDPKASTARQLAIQIHFPLKSQIQLMPTDLGTAQQFRSSMLNLDTSTPKLVDQFHHWLYRFTHFP